MQLLSQNHFCPHHLLLQALPPDGEHRPGRIRVTPVYHLGHRRRYNSERMEPSTHLLLLFLCSVVVASSVSTKQGLPISSFDEGYTHLFGDQNLVLHRDGNTAHLSLDERTGIFNFFKLFWLLRKWWCYLYSSVLPRLKFDLCSWSVQVLGLSHTTSTSMASSVLPSNCPLITLPALSLPFMLVLQPLCAFSMFNLYHTFVK